jgi:hypothetical protein
LKGLARIKQGLSRKEGEYVQEDIHDRVPQLHPETEGEEEAKTAVLMAN